MERPDIDLIEEEIPIIILREHNMNLLIKYIRQLEKPNPKPIVYICGAYSKGDPCINVHFQIMEFNKFLDDDIVTPFIPLLSHFTHTVYPRSYEDWIKYDLEMLRACDACIRMNPKLDRLDYEEVNSSGADGEEDWFREHNKPIFYNVQELYVWVKGLQE